MRASITRRTVTAGLTASAVPLSTVTALAPATAQAQPGPFAQSRVRIDAAARQFQQVTRAPGLAIGIVSPAGRELFTYGEADPATGQPVTADTLFEVGSISKTVTAALAALAADRGALRWQDRPGRHVPEVAGPGMDRLSLLNLATHTTGGMPLQFPDGLDSWDQTAAWFRRWVPMGTPGEIRSYANPSIGLLGVVAARALGGDFAELANRHLLAPLGMSRTRLRIGAEDHSRYAIGHRASGAPVRQSDGPLATEAYGVRTTVGDLLRWIEAQLGLVTATPAVKRALEASQRGWYRTGPLTQGLIWEWFAPPVQLEQLEAASAPDIVFRPAPASLIPGGRTPPAGGIVAKTGGTSGFGAYVAFSPQRGCGLVLMANRSSSIPQRLALAQELRAVLGI